MTEATGQRSHKIFTLDTFRHTDEPELNRNKQRDQTAPNRNFHKATAGETPTAAIGENYGNRKTRR